MTTRKRSAGKDNVSNLVDDILTIIRGRIGILSAIHSASDREVVLEANPRSTISERAEWTRLVARILTGEGFNRTRSRTRVRVTRAADLAPREPDFVCKGKA